MKHFLLLLLALLAMTATLRADITLVANDLLNQDRRHASTITATSHTESGSSLLHNYVTLTLRCRWEPKK